MANPFYVQPGNDFAQGLQALSQTVGQVGQQRRADEMAQLDRQAKEQALEKQVFVFQLQDMATDWGRIKPLLQSGDMQNANVAIAERIQKITDRGGDPSDTMDLRDRLNSGQITPQQAISEVDGMFEGARQAGLIQAAVGSNRAFQEFAAKAQAAGLTPGTPEYQAAARVSLGVDPRAGTITGDERIAGDAGLTQQVAGSQATIAGAEAGAKETAKLSAQSKLQPEVERAVTMARQQAQQVVDQAGEQRSNGTALRMYETAMQSLSDSLGETTTGPIAGRLPALTSNAQIAEGAVASMAPILKQMFRTAGEGTFTDKDQEMLIKMVPTRNDRPEAIDAKIKGIDAIVRAKLNVTETVEDSSLDDLVNKYAD